jgi:hypothetical protein
LTVSTSQPGSQYVTCTHGIVGLQTHGPVIVQLTQWRFTRDVQEGALPPAARAPTAIAPPGIMACERSRLSVKMTYVKPHLLARYDTGDISVRCE